VSRAGAPTYRSKLGKRSPQTMGDLLDQVEDLRAAGREADAMRLLERVQDALWEKALSLQQRSLGQ
jgi:hypothetical protein